MKRWPTARDDPRLCQSAGDTAQNQRAHSSESRPGAPQIEDQIRLIQLLLSSAFRLATSVMVESGCRVQDLASLCPADERPLSNARLDRLRPNRFLGRENWPQFTFIGRAGHEYMSCVRPETAEALDLVRLPTPRDFRHRSVEHGIKQNDALPYPIQCTRASQKAFGYSLGIHGLRHGFAQERIDDFIGSGMTWSMALERTSQLMAHYRPEEVLTYLR